MGWLFVVIFVQVMIAAAVIFVLKRLLERELIQAALEKLQGSAVPVGILEVTVKHCGALSGEVQARIQAIVRHKSQQAKVVFQEQPDLKGGLVIDVAGSSMDFSVAARLKNFWQ